MEISFVASETMSLLLEKSLGLLHEVPTITIVIYKYYNIFLRIIFSVKLYDVMIGDEYDYLKSTRYCRPTPTPD